MRIIRKSELVEGRWRNGIGVSWDIASGPPGSGSTDFGWRFAIARIDADVPFSHYPDTDRIFTLIEGRGLDLDFAGGRTLAVDQPFVPHVYACDVDTFCRLRGGSCRALNLFLRRGQYRADVDILTSNADLTHPGQILVFALKGAATVNGGILQQGDAAIAAEHVMIEAGGATVYAALLSPL